MIAAAVVCFILFVSTQALRDWPISNLNFGGGNDSAAVAPAQSLGGSPANAAAKSLEGPVTATPAKVGGATKAKAGGGGGNVNQASHPHHAGGTVSPETQIQGSRGVDSAPSNQPPSTSPAPGPTSGSPPPAGTGTASPSPSGGGSTPAGGNSGSSGGNSGSGSSGGSADTGNVGTRTARSVTHAVRQISQAATPPSAPSPVTNTVGAVQETVAPTPPPSGSTTETVTKAIGNIGK